MCPILDLPPQVVDVWLLPLEVLVSWDVLPTWVLPLSSWLPFITLFCTLFMAHLGYLHLTRASLRCCNSLFKSPGVVQTVLVQWVSVPMTLYLADRLWWLSHSRYWSSTDSILNYLEAESPTAPTTTEADPPCYPEVESPSIASTNDGLLLPSRGGVINKEDNWQDWIPSSSRGRVKTSAETGKIVCPKDAKCHKA